jgi:hypothetical protein
MAANEDLHRCVASAEAPADDGPLACSPRSFENYPGTMDRIPDTCCG